MRHKNECISLWLLEQERQKNRTRVLREMLRQSSTAQSPSIQQTPFFNNEKNHKNEEILSTLNVTKELKHLTKEKKSLEEESYRLSKEQKRLNLRIKIANVLIQDLKKRNSEKHEAVNQLKTTIHKLETQLGELYFSEVLEKNDLGNSAKGRTNKIQ